MALAARKRGGRGLTGGAGELCSDSGSTAARLGVLGWRRGGDEDEGGAARFKKGRAGGCGRGWGRKSPVVSPGISAGRPAGKTTLPGGPGGSARRGVSRGSGRWCAGPGRQRRGEGRASAGGLGRRSRVSKRRGVGRAGAEAGRGADRVASWTVEAAGRAGPRGIGPREGRGMNGPGFGWVLGFLGFGFSGFWVFPFYFSY